MDMMYRLPRFLAAVDYQAVAPLGYSMLFGNLIGYRNHVPDEWHVGLTNVANRGDMFPGDDQQVDGCYRIDIAEGDGIVILVNDVRWQFTGDNLAENAVVISFYLPHPLYPHLLSRRGALPFIESPCKISTSLI